MIKQLWNFIGTRFVAIGIINTLIDFGILNLLVYAFDLNKIVANTISVTIAMIISYFLNYKIVFRQSSKNHLKRSIIFLAITAFGLLVLQNLVIYVSLHWFTQPASIIKSILDAIGLDSITKDFILLNTAKVIGTIVSMTWNFFMYRKFVFTDQVTSDKTDNHQQ